MNDPISRWSPKRTPARECLGEGDLAYATATVKILYLKALNIRTQGGGPISIIIRISGVLFG